MQLIINGRVKLIVQYLKLVSRAHFNTNNFVCTNIS